MELQGRNLSINLQGEDVRLFQTELRQLNQLIPDLSLPDHERQEGFFGEGTKFRKYRKAICLQQRLRSHEVAGFA